MKQGTIVCDRGEVIRDVVFPISSIISVVIEMGDGDTAEVGLIGREGMSGYSIALGQSKSAHRTVVQVPDGAHSVSIEDFQRVFASEPDLRQYTLAYVQSALMLATRISACNTLHPINERCARWMLMAHDRVDDDTILLTQEYLSQMLGVRRGGVTLAAAALQDAGFITYSRGRITVRDRAGLESASCECYALIERDRSELMGFGLSKTAA